MENKKTYPYCGGEIPNNVKKCRNCGEWLIVQDKDKPKASIGCYGTLVFIALSCGIFISGGSFDIGMPIFLGVLLFLCLYFVPAIIADNKRTSQTTAIFVVNLLLGVTVIGWIGCLIWALLLPDDSKNESGPYEDMDLKKTLKILWQEFGEDLKKEKAKKQSRLDNIPKELQNKFNWGAFLWNWIWGIAYKQPITLLIIPVSIIPILGQIITLGLMFWFGKKGNLWAWCAKDWKSVEDYKNAQKKWTITGIILYCIILFSSAILLALAIICFNEPKADISKNQSVSAEAQCKKALGKANLSAEDIIICEEDLGIHVYDKAETPNASSGYAIEDEKVKTHEFMGINIDYNPKNSTEQEVENAAIECFNNNNTTAESLNHCVGIKLHWF